MSSKVIIGDRCESGIKESFDNFQSVESADKWREVCTSRGQVSTSQQGNVHKRSNLAGDLTEKKLAFTSDRDFS